MVGGDLVQAEEVVHPDFQRWFSRREAPVPAEGATAATRGRGRPGSDRAPERMGPGDVAEPIDVDPRAASLLIVTAAKEAAGFFRPTKRSEVVWVEGDSELAVGIGGVGISTGDGLVQVTIPVRCDQSGPAEVVVTFAVGSARRPAGVYAATQRRPTGPEIVVDVWGESLVAFAWHTLVILATGVAAVAGKDARGNRLVPVELSASHDGLTVLPMARHRFAGSSGLKMPR